MRRLDPNRRRSPAPSYIPNLNPQPLRKPAAGSKDDPHTTPLSSLSDNSSALKGIATRMVGCLHGQLALLRGHVREKAPVGQSIFLSIILAEDDLHLHAIPNR